eukprot:CAMPEP_0172557940 /NCGR_PEP_ID=MMETSP1067-20121228/76278_1 /TAXON_ID=265564 ORGANISM="Thalassiosira punctigera, Strain Tpunct2005C2" /NCGR_SAMPLE_ID=MMETSP1067 /ASSEMBLY_ACC=CAM_ASM_000444 /LENGTH=34 /DNA_ID= /DNA_START= /DNA_END= /DNA_ORIENTATION=
MATTIVHVSDDKNATPLSFPKWTRQNDAGPRDGR